jgi:hypothetical protein
MNYSYPQRFGSHVARKFDHPPDIYHGNWTFSALHNNGIPGNYGMFYNRRTQKMVSDIFNDDLIVYNYSFPFDRLY